MNVVNVMSLGFFSLSIKKYAIDDEKRSKAVQRVLDLSSFILGCVAAQSISKKLSESKNILPVTLASSSIFSIFFVEKNRNKEREQEEFLRIKMNEFEVKMRQVKEEISTQGNTLSTMNETITDQKSKIEKIEHEAEFKNFPPRRQSLFVSPRKNSLLETPIKERSCKTFRNSPTKTGWNASTNTSNKRKSSA